MPLSPEHLGLLGRQHWVASTSQLGELGLARRSIDRLKANGVLTKMLPGVVQLSGSPLSEDCRRMAALLYIGEDAALTTQTAGSVYGLRRMRHPSVHVIVNERRKPRAASWIRIHRTSWLGEQDIATRPDALRVLTPLRLLFELAAELSRDRFLDAAEDMWHKKLFEPPEASEFLAEVRRQGRTGVARMEEWLEGVGGRGLPMMSGLETDLALALERIGMPTPERQFPVRLGNGIEIHFDLAYPEVKLGIEPGASWWHKGDSRVRADYERDDWAAEVGWETIRFDEVQLGNLGLCADRVRRVYHQRCAELGGA